jgi:DNA-binding transcriptional MerR regulator
MNKAAEAFRTIGEVADELDVPKHVLRFWEGKFPQIRPMKRGGGRRYYRPEDMELLRGIRHLLHAEGYTIKGVQKILREHGIEQVKTLIRDAVAAGSKSGGKKALSGKADGQMPKKMTSRLAQTRDVAAVSRDDVIRAVIAELEYCRAVLAGAPREGRALPVPRASGRS